MNDDNRRLVRVVVEEDGKLLGDFDFLRLPSVGENVRVNKGVFVVTKLLHNVGPNALWAAALLVRRMESDEDHTLKQIEAAFLRSPDEYLL